MYPRHPGIALSLARYIDTSRKTFSGKETQMQPSTRHNPTLGNRDQSQCMARSKETDSSRGREQGENGVAGSHRRRLSGRAASATGERSGRTASRAVVSPDAGSCIAPARTPRRRSVQKISGSRNRRASQRRAKTVRTAIAASSTCLLFPGRKWIRVQPAQQPTPENSPFCGWELIAGRWPLLSHLY